jgi:hypothetical protein
MKAKSKQRLGASAMQGSEQARRNAALMLESLSGACGPQEASRAMGVALARYYQLEARVLQALVSALEPRARGRQVTPERNAARARAERARLERELHRYQALYRSAQKTLGIAPETRPRAEEKPGRKRRRNRRTSRGERLAKSLRTSSSHEGSAGDVQADGGV